MLPVGHCELSQSSPDSTTLFPQTAGSVHPTKKRKVMIDITIKIVDFILLLRSLFI
jgi:hypothetical protein